jgi:hypothetical protein
MRKVVRVASFASHKDFMTQKLELTINGYFFSLLNIFMTLNNLPIVGIGFGFVALYFFIKALLLKKE